MRLSSSDPGVSKLVRGREPRLESWSVRLGGQRSGGGGGDSSQCSLLDARLPNEIISYRTHRMTALPWNGCKLPQQKASWHWYHYSQESKVLAIKINALKSYFMTSRASLRGVRERDKRQSSFKSKQTWEKV